MMITSMFHRLFQKRKPQTAASERKWKTLPICRPCYGIRFPDGDPLAVDESKREICCDCGRHTLSGIYVCLAVKEETAPCQPTALEEIGGLDPVEPNNGASALEVLALQMALNAVPDSVPDPEPQTINDDPPAEPTPSFVSDPDPPSTPMELESPDPSPSYSPEPSSGGDSGSSYDSSSSDSCSSSDSGSSDCGSSSLSDS